MARAGGGSGGRGFGSSGGRSFGGRSGGSGGGSFQRGGLGGGSRPGGGARPGSSRPGGSRPPGGTGFGGFGGYGGGYNYGRGWGGPPPPPPPRRRRGWYGGPGYYGGGCFTMVMVVVLITALSAVVVFGAPAAGRLESSGSIGKSTIEREKLPGGSVNETGYYTDELGWISNSSLLLDGMESFYNDTGVQPYLYLADNIYGDHAPTGAEAQQFANELYEELFTDEAHFLLLFIEFNNQYDMWYLAGNQAKTVMDTEASDILLDYVEKYYYSSSLSDEQVFSKAFQDTGKRIMTVTRSPWIPVLIVAGIVVILLLLFLWRRRAAQQREYEDRRTDEILNTPLETFETSDIKELEDKYDGNNTQT